MKAIVWRWHVTYAAVMCDTPGLLYMRFQSITNNYWNIQGMNRVLLWQNGVNWPDLDEHDPACLHLVLSSISGVFCHIFFILLSMFKTASLAQWMTDSWVGGLSINNTLTFTLQMRCRNRGLYLQCGLSHRITKRFGPPLDLTTPSAFLFQYYTEFPQVEGSTVPTFRGRRQTALFPEPHPLKMN